MQMDKGSKCKLSRKHTQHNQTGKLSHYQTDKHTTNTHGTIITVYFLSDCLNWGANNKQKTKRAQQFNVITMLK